MVKVPTLSGENLTLDFMDSVIRPTTVRRIPGRGLPHPKDPSRKGDMLVGFDVQFPEAVNNHTKDILRNALPNK